MKSQTTISIDIELMEYLHTLPNKSEYLSRLIRLDMKAAQNVNVAKSIAQLEKQVQEDDNSYLVPR